MHDMLFSNLIFIKHNLIFYERHAILQLDIKEVINYYTINYFTIIQLSHKFTYKYCQFNPQVEALFQ